MSEDEQAAFDGALANVYKWFHFFEDEFLSKEKKKFAVKDTVTIADYLFYSLIYDARIYNADF